MNVRYIFYSNFIKNKIERIRKQSRIYCNRVVYNARNTKRTTKLATASSNSIMKSMSTEKTIKKLNFGTRTVKRERLCQVCATCLPAQRRPPLFGR